MSCLLQILLSVVLTASMDSASLWIGDQTAVHLEATVTENELVTFPTLEYDLGGLLIVDRSPVDTITKKNEPLRLRQDLIVTGFLDSLYYIDSVPFLVNGDTMYAPAMTLNVIQPFEMDTTEAIMDIKPVQAAPIWWWGIIRWILLAILLIGLGIGAYFLYRWWKSKQQPKVEVNPELLRPCDEVALEKLDKIKDEKAWQDGRNKQYFSDLTYVIREYIGRRYDVHSTEKTSDDTLQAMRPILQAEDRKELYNDLQKMLRLADLVKFAKWNPLQEESESALKAAYRFVDETKEMNANENVNDAQSANEN